MQNNVNGSNLLPDLSSTAHSSLSPPHTPLSSIAQLMLLHHSPKRELNESFQKWIQRSISLPLQLNLPKLKKSNTHSSDSDDDEEFDGVFQADFVFFDPKPSDFHGVKMLLKSYLEDRVWDITGFVDLILIFISYLEFLTYLCGFLHHVCGVLQLRN